MVAEDLVKWVVKLACLPLLSWVVLSLTSTMVKRAIKHSQRAMAAEDSCSQAHYALSHFLSSTRLAIWSRKKRNCNLWVLCWRNYRAGKQWGCVRWGAPFHLRERLWRPCMCYVQVQKPNCYYTLMEIKLGWPSKCTIPYSGCHTRQ